ncbi:vWA domain-containing protein [Rhodoflexus caldus]|uniref:VWA domain-containing protein n=1 Tax=Rhodoflexus caldus TaxID=2891236 RepID=UPI00202A941B|nr:VWA domain-containing protein [Rhodoflexus caldus]
MNQLITAYSPWFIILCIGTGLLYAALLYSQDAPWSKSTNRILAFVRFLLVSLLAFLLLEPMIRQINNEYEKPVAVVAIDNSESLALTNSPEKLKKAVETMNSVAERLGNRGFEVQMRSLLPNATPLRSFDSVRFNLPVTNLQGLFASIQNNFENRNLGAVVLLSDGIYNQGSSPLYQPVKAGIYTIGIGDTLPRNDVSIRAAYHNKIAYFGNQFPIVTEITHSGFEGREVQLSVSQAGKVLDSKHIVLGKEGALQQVQFLVTASQKGVQRYELQISPLEGEFTQQNNVRQVYIDILDGQEKILIVAASPHPDIKALRAALEKNSNYQVSLFIPNVMPNEALKRNEKYDLIIFHQLPNANAITGNLVKELLAAKTPAWFIVGTQTYITAFNALSPGVSIAASGYQTDRVTAAINPQFDKFLLSDENKSAIAKYPPLVVPFGDFKPAQGTVPMLMQRVGSLQTNKPLLVFAEQDERKIGILLGEGIWQWRLQEFSRSGEQATFDEMIGKITQYLTARQDKRKFRVNTVANEYFTGETVEFETEVYNDIYEKIYGQTVQLEIIPEKGNKSTFSYVNSGEGFRYKVSGLKQGVYNFKASTVLNGKTETAEGRFAVKEIQAEALNTRADFNLLRQLAKQSGGEFYTLENSSQLLDKLENLEATAVIHSSEENKEILFLKWLCFLLLALATGEWFVRKFRGSY